MRNKNYRKHQEDVHFKRRKKISLEKLHRYIEGDEGKLIPDFYGKKFCSPIDHKYDNVADGEPGWGCRDRSLKQQNANKHRRWIFQLKNDSIPAGNSPRKDWSMSAWERRICNRQVRHFAKLVDYIIPSNRFLVRASISKGMPKSVDE